jgi:hypothetical protein
MLPRAKSMGAVPGPRRVRIVDLLCDLDIVAVRVARRYSLTNWGRVYHTRPEADVVHMAENCTVREGRRGVSAVLAAWRSAQGPEKMDPWLLAGLLRALPERYSVSGPKVKLPKSRERELVNLSQCSWNWWRIWEGHRESVRTQRCQTLTLVLISDFMCHFSGLSIRRVSGSYPNHYGPRTISQTLLLYSTSQ